jgi:SOS-response transcriptional repressor LexA
MPIRPKRAEIRRRRNLAGLSLREFSKVAKIGFVTISNIETGKAGASPEMLDKIAAALNCSAADISEELPFELPRDPSQERGVPVVGVVNAGNFSFSYDMPPETHLPLRLDLPGSRRAVALRVSGDCMVNPKDPKGSLYDGDYVIIVEPNNKECPNGKIAVVRLGGDEYTLKRVFKTKDGYELKPDNDKYKSIFIKGDIDVVGIKMAKWSP